MAQQPSHPIAAAAARRDITKDIALQYAAERGHGKLVKLLPKEGATIDVKIDRLRTSLHAEHSIPTWCPPTAVHLAVKNRHQETVKILLEHEQRIPLCQWFLKDGRWMAALHEAVAKNDIAMTKLMLKRGVNVHYPDMCADCLHKYYEKTSHGKPLGSFGCCGRCQGRTALHIAAEHGYEDMVRLLIRHGATRKSQAVFGTTPLHLAAQGGHDGVVLALLENGWKPGKIIYGSSPVLFAAQNGHKTTVDLLIKHGAVPIRSLEWEVFPLIKTGNAKALGILLPHANKIIYKHDLQRMFEDAASSGDTKTVLLLLNYAVAQERLSWVDYFRIFYFAAEKCESRVVQELVNNCPCAQLEQNEKIPALLFQAGCGGCLDSILILLKWGNKSLPCSHYVTNALFGAIKSGHLSLIDALSREQSDTPLKKKIYLRKGLPSTDGLNIDGCAHLPLHTAAHYGHPEVCQLLLDQGLSVDEYDRYGKTALHYAPMWGSLETLDLLLDRGARIDALDKKLGQTALHGAARTRSSGSGIKLLLRRGANINAKDIQARTPLHLAGIEGNDDIYRLLLDQGANPDAEDDAGWTASQHLAEVQARRLESN